jgi:hypothetical protein
LGARVRCRRHVDWGGSSVPTVVGSSRSNWERPTDARPLDDGRSNRKIAVLVAGGCALLGASSPSVPTTSTRILISLLATHNCRSRTCRSALAESLALKCRSGHSARMLGHSGTRRLGARSGSRCVASTIAIFALGPTMGSCRSADCKSYAAPGLVVRIVSASGTPVCDAIVIAKDHDYSEQLQPLAAAGDAPQCQYFGAYERTGTYTVDASLSGGSASVKNVKVGADHCHVHPRTLEMTLSA